MKKDNNFISFLVFFILVCTISVLSQVESSTAQVFESIYYDTSPPLRDIPEAPNTQSKWQDGLVPLKKIEPQFEDPYRKDESLQKFMGSQNISSIIQNWNGISADGYAPPDPSGDVGPNHYMLATNVRFQIWNKTGTSLLGPLNLGTIWSGFPGPWASSLNDGDPIVLYDEAAGRWFIAQFSLPNYPSSPSYILIAISQTGDPTGSWHRYGFTFNYGIPDYPKFGIWPDGYYMSANGFYPSEVIVAAFERSQMLNGNAAQMIMFTRSTSSTWSLLPADWNGTTTPPSGAPNYFGQLHDNARYGGSDGFDIFSFSVNWITPSNSTFTGPTFLATNAFSTVNGIPQSGTSTLLDDLSDRAMNRLDYRNFGTHQSMVVCHTVDAGSGRAGVRWYEFRRTSGSWSIYQQGTYAPADGLHRWMGSIAINSTGDIALGYSVSGSSIYPGIRYTGRLIGDTPGQMTITEETIQAGLGAQTNLERWGDYNQMNVDPNGETFWYVNEYLPSTGSFNWRTKIASLEIGPPCAIGLPSNPTPANAATSVSINLSSLNWTNGAGATQCEVWFGTSGNLTKVYDGTLTQSWAITGPLSYNTTYSWQIVGKNVTCSVSGPLWTFTTEQNPNLVVDTIFVYPQNLNYWTGTCNSSSKTQVSLVDADGNGFAGWMVFDISSIPADAIISSIEFNGYLYENNYPYWAITPMGSVNPVTGTASTIFTQVSNNYQQGTAYSYNEEVGDLPLGWLQRSLNEGGATTQMQNALAQGWFAVGVYEFENGTTYFVNFQGWAQANRPYLEVIYEYINIDVTDPTSVSATPISNSQINIAFTPNANNNNVVIVWNSTGIFTAPAGTPPTAGQPFAGGTLLYNGTASPVNHLDLSALTSYYYKLFSYDGINYSPGVNVNATTLDFIQAEVDFGIVVHDNAGSSSTINFGLDLTATDGTDFALGEDELPGLPPGGYFAAWLFPDFTTLSYMDYRAPGNPPAFPFAGHKSHVIRIQTDVPAGNPITISWNLPSTIAATSTIGVPGNQVSFSGTGSHTWNYNPVNLSYIFVEVDYIVTANTFELNVSVQNGWNMVSAPGLHPTDQNVTTWWSHNTGTVWEFNGVQYVAKTVTTPGEGYWMKNTLAETYNYPAITIVPHNPVPATLGWNMMGGYETSPTIDNLKLANPQITGTVWGFNGTQYVAATNLVPGYGYWVKVTTAGNITIPDALAKGNEVVELFKEDWGRIILTDAAGLSYTLYAVKGDSPNGGASVDLSQYEMPPMPPSGIFDIRFSSGRIAEDINSSIQTIDMVGITYPLTVRVEGMDIRLQDATGKALNQNLKSGEDVVISDATIQKLMVTSELIPAVYALEQNYPNPFNPSTMIEFSLPEDVGNVKLSIYNALGEKVAELVNTSLTAGRYSYQWNAQNVATGMYIYELRTDKFVSIKKMLLLK